MEPNKLRSVVSFRTDLDREPKNGLKPLRKRRAMPGHQAPANGNAGPDELPSITAARERLRALISQATAGMEELDKPGVGIVLAIVNQETGHHAAANALIDEYQLDTLFGIKKFG